MAATTSPPLHHKIRRLVFGKPIPTAHEHHERLSLFFGLPVFAFDDSTHTLRVHMASIRQKIEPDPAHPRFIRTETGVGYRMLLE